MTWSVQPGTVLPAQEFTLTRGDLVRYAGASGDFNPIHWSDRVATGVGLPGVIAHGMLTLGLAAQAVAHWTDGAEMVEFGAKFTNPVVVPDDDTGVVIRFEATVKSVEDGLVTLALLATCGEVKILGMPKAVVRA